MKKSKFEINTKTMAYMAIFAALQIVLEYLTQFTPQMPQGGNVAFSLVALMLCSYLMGPIYGLVVSLVCVGLHFVLGLATFYGALSVIFDYLLPMAIVGVVGIIPLIKVNKVEIPIGIIIVMVLKTISHLIAGWYAFATPLPANLSYNLPYNIATMVACFILFMILYPRLKRVIRI